jgi:16S rRNA (cytidine1402-2'-O)-methyltransferase
MPLYIVATPIGNLEDITFRAVRILKEVEVILCEDTRHSLRLLNKFGIKKPLLSYHDFNKEEVAPGIIRRLQGGESFALITDAGTPGISDPAFNIVKSAIEAGIAVIPVPGASAVISALVASGLPTDRFCFEGFLPAKKGRKKRLEKLILEERTIILFEAPHRIERTLDDLLNTLGDRRIVIAREMTKIHEEFVRGKISEIKGKFKYKGELVLMVEGKCTP